MEPIEIPQTLDEPPLALIFNAYHLFSFIGFAIIGVIIDHMIISSIFGIFFGQFATKYSDTKPDGYIRHFCYAKGIPTISVKKYPHGLDREFRP